MKIGIIGNGRFGDVLFKAFTNFSDYEVLIYSRREIPDNKKFFSLKDTVSADIVIPSVPISNFKDQLIEIKNIINPNALVIDVCSVSVMPADEMRLNLPKSTDLLSTHPMFGPDSTKDVTFFTDLKFIFCSLRIKDEKRVNDFLEFWKKLGCEMIELTPEEHDMQAAYTHAFAFLVGKIGMKLNIRRNHISTKGFEGILYNQTAVENDTGQLFHDMMTYNPYTSEMREKVRKALEDIEAELKN